MILVDICAWLSLLVTGHLCLRLLTLSKREYYKPADRELMCNAITVSWIAGLFLGIADMMIYVRTDFGNFFLVGLPMLLGFLLLFLALWTFEVSQRNLANIETGSHLRRRVSR
jgi:hypothetical protein